MSVEHSQGSAVYLIHSRKCPFKNAAVVSFAGYLQRSNDLKQVSGKENVFCNLDSSLPHLCGSEKLSESPTTTPMVAKSCVRTENHQKNYPTSYARGVPKMAILQCKN